MQYREDFFGKCASVLYNFKTAVVVPADMIPHLRQVRQVDSSLFSRAYRDILQFESAVEVVVEHLVVEICIGNGCKEGINNKARRLPVSRAFLAQLTVYNRQTADSKEQLVHSGGSLGFLTTDTLHHTTLAACRFLTLVAEHLIHHSGI